MKQSRGRRGVTACAVSLAVFTSIALAACSSESGASGAGSAGSHATAPSADFPGKVASGAPIKIGLINNEGGQGASQPENREAAEAAATYANDNLGGIGGRHIDLVICKNAEEPTSARDCANRMVEAGVSAVVVTSTALGDLIVPIVTGAGIPYISAAGQSTQELTANDSFLWTGGFPASLKAMAEFAHSKKMKNVTALTAEVPAAVNGLQSMGASAFKAEGVDLKVVTIPTGTPDATPQVSAALQDNPDGVVIIGDGTVCTAALKSLATLGYAGEKMGIQGCATPDVVRAVGSSINGTQIFTAAKTVGDDPESVLYRSVMAKYSPSTDIDGYAYVGYQGMLGLVRATRSLDGSDVSPAAIAAAIRSAKNVALPVGGGMTFTCDGTANPALKAVCSNGSVVATVEDGKLSDARVVTS